ncbi:unnamed protein product [Bursaphelenchus xylophilus]|uniref:Aldehyde dehydrogenase n=1 Tax=Bursaphelenchus xylophilus TaxID=6326 RepID=A0A1I7RJ09_BURXY|nr:unnamed protein product [Bursaphelenchus xylophilus]CAG9119226.1 unnamed protein product [Bursaphelenchus xylophilus]
MNLKLIVRAQRSFFLTHKTKSVECRTGLLRSLKEGIEKKMDNLTEAVYEDLKRSPTLTEKYEIVPVLKELTNFIDNIDKWAKPQALPATPKGRPYLYKEPLGVVCVIGPYNLPLALNLLPAVAALAAGNTVVVKPSELAPFSTQALDELIKKNCDEHHFTTVIGGFDATMKLLAERFDHIYYAGSPRIGRIIMREASHFLTPVTLELGGKNPVIVYPDADIDSLAEQLIRGKWLNCGQHCLHADYLVVFDNETREALRHALKKQIEKHFGKHPKESPLYSRLINKDNFNRVSDLLWKTDGEFLYQSPDPEDADDNFIGPHVIEVKTDDVLMEDEVFGPVLLVVKFENEHEIIEYINSNEKPLALYVFTKNQEKADLFINRTSSGGVCINGISDHAQVEGLPFGGIGGSGTGRYHGKYGFDTFTHEKAVFVKD